jgi:hypothetical protein
MKIQHVIYGVLGAALMAFVVYGSIVPYPAYPYNFLPPAFVIFMVIGAIWFAVLKGKSPETLRLIANDMEG